MACTTGVLSCWWYIVRNRKYGHQPSSRLSGSKCRFIVHQHWFAQPGCTWSPLRSSPMRWWSKQCTNGLMVNVLGICSCHIPKEVSWHPGIREETGRKPVVSLTVALVTCLYMGSGGFDRVTMCQKHPVTKQKSPWKSKLLTHISALGGHRFCTTWPLC